MTADQSLTQAAGLVILRYDESGWRLIALRQYRNWDLPKGLADSGENLLDAAKREATEETGLDRFEFPWGFDYRDTEPYKAGRMLKTVRVFLAHAPAGDAYLPVSAELGRPEHHELRWVDFAAARALLPARFHPMLDWAEVTTARAAASPAMRPSVTAASNPLPDK
jgi:bis(5'-nucleosidyl)-tetraphosphatase